MSANITGTQSTSLFETVGGTETLKIAVDRFYERVLADAQLRHYFDGVDIPRVKRHQVLLFSQVLGGPAQYAGRALGEAHAGLDITGADYDRVVEHLVGTLGDLGVDSSVVSAVEGVVADVRPDIVLVHAEP
jgi:hemoglobin